MICRRFRWLDAPTYATQLVRHGCSVKCLTDDRPLRVVPTEAQPLEATQHLAFREVGAVIVRSNHSLKSVLNFGSYNTLSSGCFALAEQLKQHLFVGIHLRDQKDAAQRIVDQRRHLAHRRLLLQLGVFQKFAER